MKHPLYHCGRCGSIFESSLGADERRLCGTCERKPGTGVWPVKETRPTEREGDLATFGKKGEALDTGGQRAVRKKSSKNVLMRIVFAWLILMSLAVWIRTQYARSEAARDARLRVEDKNLAEGTMADERIALMSQALPACHRALAGFLTGGTPEIRNQFVANPIETAGKMAVFYQGNPFPRVDVEGIRRTAQEPVLVGDEWMIETRWKSGDGLEFDAIFRRDAGTWKLDWEHFSRYGEYSWPLFLAGEGPDVAEFRLLVRKVAVGDEAERGGSRLRFTLLSPEFGKPGETGMESPEFVINRRSDEGLLLEAAFDAKESGELLFGGSLKPMEPEAFVRLRVRIKRGEFGGIRSFDIDRIIACHWISSEKVGFDLEALRDDLFGSD